MKRIVFLLFLAMSTTTYAQSLMVVEQDTVVEINSTAVADYGFHIKIKNIKRITVRCALLDNIKCL